MLAADVGPSSLLKSQVPESFNPPVPLVPVSQVEVFGLVILAVKYPSRKRAGDNTAVIEISVTY